MLSQWHGSSWPLRVCSPGISFPLATSTLYTLALEYPCAEILCLQQLELYRAWVPASVYARPAVLNPGYGDHHTLEHSDADIASNK
jgi:hypothetical protein